MPRHLLPALLCALAATALASCKKPAPTPAESKPAETRIPGASSKEVWTPEQLEFLQKKFGELTTLPSGLKYKVLQAGTGEPVPRGKRVSVHYQGRFLSDQVFDDSRRRDKPLTFAVGTRGAVIDGFNEAIGGMAKGEKRLAIIPYWLGYGPRYHGSIPPSSTLVFEIELLGWEDTKAIPMSQS